MDTLHAENLGMPTDLIEDAWCEDMIYYLIHGSTEDVLNRHEKRRVVAVGTSYYVPTVGR